MNVRRFNFAFAFLGLAVAVSSCTLIVGSFEGPGGTIVGPACMAPTDCPAPENSCIQNTCTEGQCGTQFLPVGDQLTADSSHDCHATACDGNGAISRVLDTKNVPQPNNPCVLGTCDSGGNTGMTNAPSRMQCMTSTVMNGLCDGNGNCVVCLMASDCPSGQACSPQDNCVTMGCGDGVQNGMETDIDCGGGGNPPCDRCDTGKHCLMNADCKSKVCTAGICAAATCMDGVQNGAETDIDCGGGTCPPCGPTLGCNQPSDCVGDQCDANTMKCTPNCSDKVQNNNETDVDCGGGTCNACPVMKKCKVDTDCTSQACDAITLICVPNQCLDHQQDGTETDVDCGGSCGATCVVMQKCMTAADCASAACDAMTLKCTSTACSDNQQDGNETDKDCGGNVCAPCANGLKCLIDSDCMSTACDTTTKTCDTSHCLDGHKDNNETDVDCGGGTCPACGVGKGCNVDNDCSTSACDNVTGKCATACMDQKKDGTETDIDCGGSCTAKCGLNQGCLVDNDCASNACDALAHVCVGSQCVDHQKDGVETDTDCGGGTCGACGLGFHCVINADCASNACDAQTLTCVSMQCNDHHQDGSETDVDCGGACTSKCAVGKGCLIDGDCASNACDAVSHTCVMSQCSDHMKDGNETDQDCGGGTCGACTNGLQCLANSDCTSNACNNCVSPHTCIASQCSDCQKDGTETDVDCGGSCPTKCALNKGCLVNADCGSNACDALSHLCVSSQCADHHQDGSETDSDCGGGTCGACGLGLQCLVNSDCSSNACNTCVSPHVCISNQCSDCQKDGTETDTDCGGSCASKCALGKGCSVNADCASNACDSTSHVCDMTQCVDHHQDGSETDVDCGGGTCPGCGVGLHCSLDSDCTSGFCDNVTGLCASTHCVDQKKDSNETDTDCGGGTCGACPTGKHCIANSDCTTSACDTVTTFCVANQCVDQHQDGVETDQDCGGGTCPTCTNGLKCVANTDCASGACSFCPAQHVCGNNLCSDCHQDGAETDVDCGGGTCPCCTTNQKCLSNIDCCAGHVCLASKLCS